MLVKHKQEQETESTVQVKIHWESTGNPLGIHWESTGDPLGILIVRSKLQFGNVTYVKHC